MKQTKENEGQALAVERIPRLVARFTATTLAALLLNAVYTLTDALFVSWGVGDAAMGGISVVLPFVLLQGAVSTAVGSGAASIVSRRLGEGRRDKAGAAALNAMVIFYACAAVLTILGFLFMNPLLRAMGVTGELYTYSKQYFTLILAGTVFSTGFSSIIRAEGRMLYGLLIWLIPISVNIVLDAVFILVLGWGVPGSALATVLCQFTSFCMSVLFFTRFSSLNFKGAKPRLRQMGEVLAIGLPSLVQMGSLSVMSAVLNRTLGSVGGTLAVTGFAYINRIATFVVVPFTAVSQALAPIAGYNYGAGNLPRVRKTVRFCTGISLAYACFAVLLLETAPELLLRAFTTDGALIRFGARGLRMIAPAFLFMPLPVLAGATFQAQGKKAAAFVLYASNLVLMAPAAALLSRYAGVDGIWLAYSIANAGAALMAILIALGGSRRQRLKALRD